MHRVWHFAWREKDQHAKYQLCAEPCKAFGAIGKQTSNGSAAEQNVKKGSNSLHKLRHGCKRGGNEAVSLLTFYHPKRLSPTVELAM